MARKDTETIREKTTRIDTKVCYIEKAVKELSDEHKGLRVDLGKWKETMEGKVVTNTINIARQDTKYKSDKYWMGGIFIVIIGVAGAILKWVILK